MIIVGGPQGTAGRRFRRPHVVVLGNEKGGSGKSTTAMHLIVALLREGYKVGSLDLDARQGSLSRFIANRAENGLDLPAPRHVRLEQSALDSVAAAREEEKQRFDAVMAQMADCDFIVIDTPGSDSNLSRLGHARADTLVTPLNDSFLDLDLLARVDGQGQKIRGPSTYAEMVWEQKKRRALADGGSIDWIVMRNRLASLDARNKRRIGKLVEELARRIGFRLAPGFSERVVFRELFPRGLTLLDLADAGTSLTLSHVAARQELRGLLDAIGLPKPEEGAPVERRWTEPVPVPNS
ncbi:MAG TPA: division plane positioning ATPase MipZ [Hypericibacter adhaerens]|jgi:chromosome partitioning protein|uniref:ATPase n=1 Tax=Hypericibacter adhaerens TaxID=2602016 RepID=A0A5J6MWC4_9PROT|nr:division plane positioning ATPase MipZ [Hypericibacter adhaerens]QEX21454.1 ATPase [Hypericibacter adhaerens]HWA43184.1 division plane positioning ATPase MipZ [Hypericibacter adhaerens]